MGLDIITRKIAWVVASSAVLVILRLTPFVDLSGAFYTVDVDAAIGLTAQSKPFERSKSGQGYTLT